MKFGAKLLASVLGIGYIQKGAGTVVALLCCVFWYLFLPKQVSLPVTLSGIVILFFVGVWSSGIVESDWGKDAHKVVIDELLGMSVSLFLVPIEWQYIILAFVFFRFFDIVKPLYIRKAERLPSGWGVMMDDLLAGIISNVLVQLIVWTT